MTTTTTQTTSKSEYLRATFSAWMRCREESAEVLMAAQPIIRATVASTLGNRVDLRDEAESMALEYLWKHLKDCRTDVVAWVRYVARGRALDAIKRSARSKEFGVDSFHEIATAPLASNHAGLDRGLLTPIQRRVADLLAEGASRREIEASMRLSRGELEGVLSSLRVSMQGDGLASPVLPSSRRIQDMA